MRNVRRWLRDSVQAHNERRITDKMVAVSAPLYSRAALLEDPDPAGPVTGTGRRRKVSRRRTQAAESEGRTSRAKLAIND